METKRKVVNIGAWVEQSEETNLYRVRYSGLDEVERSITWYDSKTRETIDMTYKFLVSARREAMKKNEQLLNDVAKLNKPFREVSVEDKTWKMVR